MRTMVWAIGLALASGCFSDSGGIGDYTTTAAASTGSGTAPTSTGGDTGTGTSTSTSTSTGTGGSGSTASVSDATGSTTSTLGGEGDACDPWAQDCADGLKCAPYASDDGDAWDANKCTPVGEGASGGPCIAMKSMTSGYDTCEQGAICWDVDPATLSGVCYAMCKGSPNTPICPPNSACSMTNGGTVNVCLGTCDPLQPKCAAGQVCVPDGSDQFLCFADAGQGKNLYETCMFINECEPGLMCAAASKNGQCDGLALQCCTAFCDLEDPNCDVGACVPFFEMGAAPMGLENLGLCEDP